MFEKITPEAAGVSSREVLRFLKSLENRGLRMHSVLLMKGDSLFSETYWAPFDKETVHRMYSQTKSFVSVAIGLLEAEGKIDLDRPIASYFPDRYERELPPYLARQTVREMLTMTTCGEPKYWFYAGDPDRTHLYFETQSADHPSGTLFLYDSAGSQVLSSLVEKLSGQSLFDFLSDRVFSHLGTFRSATILKTPCGDSWGDSALVCTPRDMASFGRLLMKGGEWNGKRILPKAYLEKATSRLTSSLFSSELAARHGYGYQFWRCEKNGFCLFGMGNQYTVCLPDKDLLFVCTADDQGIASGLDLIFGAFFDFVYDTASEAALPEDPEGYAVLEKFGASRTLYAEQGAKNSPWSAKINGKKYVLTDNQMGIRWITLDFDKNELQWENAQGEKCLPFGLCENVFGHFPQFGYSDGVGGIRTTDGFTYRCAASGAWKAENVFTLYVQVIDRYFGNLTVDFGFKGNELTLRMKKNAEAFFDEYNGSAVGKTEE